MKFKMVINVIIAAARGFLTNQAVAAAIKDAAVEAMSHGEWDKGEKTAFVLEAGRKVVAATPNKYDDFVYPILADLYVRKYLNGVVEVRDDTSDPVDQPSKDLGKYGVVLGQLPKAADYPAGGEVYQYAEEPRWVVNQKGVGAGKPKAPWHEVEFA